MVENATDRVVAAGSIHDLFAQARRDARARARRAVLFTLIVAGGLTAGAIAWAL